MISQNAAILSITHSVLNEDLQKVENSQSFRCIGHCNVNIRSDRDQRTKRCKGAWERIDDTGTTLSFEVNIEWMSAQ